MAEDMPIRLFAALGIRPVRVPDLPAPSILLSRYNIMLVDADLNPTDRPQVLQHALNHATETTTTAGQ